MPVMDGFESTRRVRALEGPRSRTFIVALTGGVTVEEQETCRTAGMDAFIPKPLQAARLPGCSRCSTRNFPKIAARSMTEALISSNQSE